MLDLIKINQNCRQYTWPGLAVTESKKGLPLAVCYSMTQLTLWGIYEGKKCHYRKEQLFPDGRETADPSQCEYCQPRLPPSSPIWEEF